jgi:hypothetical protein
MSEKCVDVLFERNTYPFQISVNYVEAVHIHQTVRDFNQLNNTSTGLLWEWGPKADVQAQCGSHADPSEQTR